VACIGGGEGMKGRQMIEFQNQEFVDILTSSAFNPFELDMPNLDDEHTAEYKYR